MAINAYEAERDARIQRNKERMQELNLPSLADDFQASVRRKQAKTVRQPVPRAQLHTAEQRRSSRLANVAPAQYSEAELASAEALYERDCNRFRGRFSAETYTEEHVKALGDFKEEWTLFEDGYDSQRSRIYSKDSGQTCHQCRQKTLGLRTTCSSCQSMKGVFCGDCLFMRYGENVREAKANPTWTCPNCRDLCNCSVHRARRGWAPTGTYYRRAIAKGYKSVAHYLILTNLAKPTAPVAPIAEAPLEQAGSNDGPSAGTGALEGACVAMPAPDEPVEACKKQRITQPQITDLLAPNKRQAAVGKTGKAGRPAKVRGAATTRVGLATRASPVAQAA